MIHQDSHDMGIPVDPPTTNGVRVSPKHRPRVIRTDIVSNGSMNGPLYMQTPKTVLVRRLKSHDDGAWKQMSRWFVENQIGFAFNLISLLFLAHASIPKARDHTIKFFALSYLNPSTGDYAIGHDDAYLISFCVVLFTGLRAACMEYVLAPYAKWRGLSKQKDITRFSEQAWLCLYATVFWSFGLYVYVHSPYWLNMRELWTEWPIREIPGITKTYILLQWSFWLQQVIVINIEDKRKDHWQMLAHHFVTILLIHSCYVYHQTRVGHLILVLMDVVDILLPLAKCLKYLGHSILCDYVFGAFMVVWFFSRHVGYMAVVWSVWKHTPEIINLGCYKGTRAALEGPFEPPNGLLSYLEPFHSNDGVVCFDYPVQAFFLGALLFLQAITIAWAIAIVKVAVKVIKGMGAEDTRSDDECEEEGDELDERAEEFEKEMNGNGHANGNGNGFGFEFAEGELVEEDVGIEEIDLQAWERRAGVKRAAGTTGVSLPGHSDRKEFLGRIGCEKQVD